MSDRGSARAVVVALLALSVAPASHAAPANDKFASAITIPTVPYVGTGSSRGAEYNDPTEPSDCSSSKIYYTVWYRWKASTTQRVVAAIDSPFVANLAVYSGTSLPSLLQMGCGSVGDPVTFWARAGTTYYFQIGDSHNEMAEFTWRVERAPASASDEYTLLQGQDHVVGCDVGAACVLAGYGDAVDVRVTDDLLSTVGVEWNALDAALGFIDEGTFCSTGRVVVPRLTSILYFTGSTACGPVPGGTTGTVAATFSFVP